MEREWNDVCLEGLEFALFHIRHNPVLKTMCLTRIRAGEKVFGPSIDIKPVELPQMALEELADLLNYLGVARAYGTGSF